MFQESPSAPLCLQPALDWFAARGWKPFAFQRETWEAYLRGASGLVHAPTGMGKTYSVWMGPLLQWIAEHPGFEPVSWGEAETAASRRARSNAQAAVRRAERPSRKIPKRPEELEVLRAAIPPAERCLQPLTDKVEPPVALWITPLRALANDTLDSLRAPVAGLRLPWSVELRTGDSSSSVKARQRTALPTVLVTTPESLTVLLSYPETRDQMATLRCVVVDEWHELLGSKRGTQTELALARLRRWNPRLHVWGLSATLGNLAQARDILLGGRNSGILVQGPPEKAVELVTLLPGHIDRFPWVGHIGTRLLPQVLSALDRARTTLLFTNVRSGAEIWYQALVEARPHWSDQIGIHHGSLEREHREAVEARLRAGTIRCVVCTSSLDLGVDFPAVDQVIQVGSPKGIARLLQRAGRSGHQPGRASRILCVPTHAFELVEYAAVRDALDRRKEVSDDSGSGRRKGTRPCAGDSAHPATVESRLPIEHPLDVLVQHLVTVALGGGFDADDIGEEIRSAWSYRHLTDEELGWCLDFVTRGGNALRAYAQYRRVDVDPRTGRHHVTSEQVARFHRLGIGTIVSEKAVSVRLQGGPELGTVEESFAARLSPGDRFVFAGRILELIRLRDMTALVRFATSTSGAITRWMGAKMPMSSRLAELVRGKLDEARRGVYAGPEMEAVRPILAIQARWSRIPGPHELLIEEVDSEDGHHVFVFPFEGRAVHEGLGALAAFRISRREPCTVSVMVNDYGFELRSAEPLELDEGEWRALFSSEGLVEDLLACLNSTELARRQFREIARIAGLVFGGYPGAGKSARQVQATSGLIYDVFARFDPDNLLLDQARREVLDRQLEVSRLRATLERMAGMKIVLTRPRAFTPLAFPLWAAFTETEVSSERLADRIQRMSLELEELAEAEAE